MFEINGGRPSSSSRSSLVIDLAANRKPVQLYILVIIKSNFCRISYRFRVRTNVRRTYADRRSHNTRYSTLSRKNKNMFLLFFKQQNKTLFYKNSQIMVLLCCRIAIVVVVVQYVTIFVLIHAKNDFLVYICFSLNYIQ